MAFNFNWSRAPKIPTQLMGPDVNEEMARQATMQDAAQSMAGYKPSVDINSQMAMQGYAPADNSMKGGNAQPNLEGYGESLQAASDAAAQAQAVEQQKAELQSQISALENRIAENTAKLQKWTGNADQIAAIEARKINSQDPTMIWRWKSDKDEARRIANMEKEKTKATQQNNVKFEIDNTLSSITPRSDASSEEIQRDITKLYDLRTLAQKNEMPKSEIDKIDARIESLRNPKSDASEEAGENKDIFDEMTNLNTPEKKNARVEQLLARPEKTKPGDWAEVLKNPDGMDKNLVIKAKAEYGKALDRQKAEREAKEKEDTLLKKGKNLTSKDIEWLKGRKGLKYHTDDYGNEFFTRG